MYQVSNAFLEQMKSPIQEHKVTGTIGSVSFDEANIVEGSFSISNQSTDTNDVVLGSCYVGQLTAEFVGINIAYGKWINKTITLSFGLKVGEYYEYVPLGVYKVKEAKHTDHGVQVTAYDNMIKFDKKFKKSHFMNLSGMTNIIDQLCTDAGVVCGMSHAQIEALPNGDRTGINIYGSKGKKAEFANDITTLRDLLFWVAQTLGCFATMNRAGQLEFRQYTQTVVDRITEQHRIAGATFADYITHYIGIYVENLDDNTEDYYGYDATALQQELTETTAEITADQGEITDLEEDRTEWVQKLANHECTQEEYDAAIAGIDAQEKALTKEINQLSKRAEWLSNAISMSADDGSDMVLGANPLVMAKNLTTRDQQRREILGALSNISYTPFNASVVCGCIYDLGDVIQFSGGLYNSDTDSFGCVMSYTYTHNGGTELEGFGVDPSVVVVRNKTQKSVDRASKNSVDAPRNYIGTSDPTGGGGGDAVAGKDGDIFVRVGGRNLIDIIYDHGSYFVDGGVIKDAENKYSITVNGTPSDPYRNYIVYRLLGLTVGAEYSYSLKVHYNIGHTWGNYGGVDDFRIGDESVTNVLVKTNDEREYSGTFTAKESGGIVPLIFEFSDSKDGVPMIFYCEDLLITPTDNSVKGIYVNDGGAWKNVDYVNDVSQTQSETGGTEIAEISNSDGTKTKIYQKTVEANPTGTPSETLQTMNIGGELYSLGGGNVDDVKVDNVSVVTNKIANINTMTGANGTNAGAKGLVPAPTATDNEKYLRGDGTWGTGGNENLFGISATPSNSLGREGDRYYVLTRASEKYKYLKWEVYRTRGATSGRFGCGEIDFIDEDSNKFSWPGTTVTCNKPCDPTYCPANTLIDGNYDRGPVIYSSPTVSDPHVFTLTLGDEIDFGAHEYTFRVYLGWNTGLVNSNHDPVAFNLYGSKDGSVWSLLDSVDNSSLVFPYTSQIGSIEHYQLTGTVLIKLDGQWQLDVDGEKSVVANPQETATENLTKVGIDGTVYAVTDDDAVHSADIGVAGGVAELDNTGRVPSSQLPSYVDDVVEYASRSAFPATGESGKIYVALDTNLAYRWGGTEYVEISPSLALGETSSTAYRGDRGKAAYDHTQLFPIVDGKVCIVFER